jgi:hypothetical protein
MALSLDVRAGDKFYLRNVADSLKDRGPRDRNRINVYDASELRYWSDQFGIDPKYLREAVLIAGPLANDVEELLWKTSALCLDDQLPAVGIALSVRHGSRKPSATGTIRNDGPLRLHI